MKKLNLNLFDFALLSSVLTINIITIFIGNANLIGFVSSIVGVCCVILMAKGHKYSCYFSIVNNILYGYLSFSACLYGEAILNIYFLLMSVFALINWDKNSKKDGVTIKSRKLEKNDMIIGGMLTIVLILAFAFFLKSIGNKLPLWDSCSTTLAVVSMYLFVNRYTEQWFLWTIVNLFTLNTWALSLKNGVNVGVSISMVIMWSAYVINSVRGFLVWGNLEK